MSKLIDLYVHLNEQERAVLLFEHGSEMKLKVFLSKSIDRLVEKEIERIQLSEKYQMRNSIIESDDSESEAV